MKSASGDGLIEGRAGETSTGSPGNPDGHPDREVESGRPAVHTSASAASPTARLVFHPYLFAAYPILALYPANANELQFSALLSPLIVIVGLTGCLVGIFKVFGADPQRAGLHVSLSLALFFSFGHVAQALESWKGQPWDGAVVSVYLATFLLVAHGIQSARHPGRFGYLLNRISALFCLVPLTLALVTSLEKPQRPAFAPVPILPGAVDLQRPDIYHILLDGYARADTLAEYYSHDNTPFLRALEDRGFIVCSQAFSNYTRTDLTFFSMLNATHVTDLLQSGEVTPDDFSGAVPYIRDNRAIQNLRQLGYKIVRFETAWSSTEGMPTDVLLAPSLRVSELHSLILGMTPLFRTAMKRMFLHLHRSQIQFVLEGIAGTASIPGPKYVLAHVVSPHWPFVFREDGSFNDPGPIFFNVLDPHGGSNFTVEKGPYRRQYADQLKFVNREILKGLDGLLGSIDPNAIVLIHSDHGPQSLLGEPVSIQARVRERMRILLAWRVPPGMKHRIESRMSPITIFPRILSYITGKALPEPPQRAYRVGSGDVPVLEEVTSLIDDPPSGGAIVVPIGRP